MCNSVSCKHYNARTARADHQNRSILLSRLQRCEDQPFRRNIQHLSITQQHSNVHNKFSSPVGSMLADEAVVGGAVRLASTNRGGRPSVVNLPLAKTRCVRTQHQRTTMVLKIKNPNPMDSYHAVQDDVRNATNAGNESC